jgi:hypothetical protein
VLLPTIASDSQVSKSAISMMEVLEGSLGVSLNLMVKWVRPCGQQDKGQGVLHFIYAIAKVP